MSVTPEIARKVNSLDEKAITRQALFCGGCKVREDCSVFKYIITRICHISQAKDYIECNAFVSAKS